jgi:hypothetical protein
LILKTHFKTQGLPIERQYIHPDQRCSYGIYLLRIAVVDGKVWPEQCVYTNKPLDPVPLPLKSNYK